MRKLLFLLLTLVSTMSYSQDTIDTNSINLQEVTIQGVRADEKTPISQKTITKKDIDNIYRSQEMPVMLNMTPSITSSTDGGHNMGYSYFRLRGIDQTRINMTLDGVPLNEPEDQGVYFTNYPDFANSIKSMQIQRGVGTSTNGVSSYAGSINFESIDGFEKSTETQLALGPVTYRFSLENSTGLTDKKTAFYTRFSTFDTEGYRYNSGSKGYSFFMTGGYYGRKDIVKVTAFSGRSFNQMAWFAVSETDIENDPRTNYNTEREDDDFMQSMVILKYKHNFNNKSSLSTSAFYNRLDGNWKLDLEPLGAGPDVLNFMLSSNFYGLVSNYNLTTNKYRLNAGISGNMYERYHSMAVLPSTDKLYKNVGLKSEVSSYVKFGYDINKFTLFGDAQIRYVNFTYNGFMKMTPFEWVFFNPKGGLMYTHCKHYNFYASIGQSHREPTRTDIFAGEDDPVEYYDVNPESVVDYELGTNINLNNLKLQANVFYMDFKNEITLLGAIGSNGLPLMTNVENSFRSGLELDVSYKLFDKKVINVVLANSSSYNYSRIKDNGQEFQPLYTPNLIINQIVSVMDKDGIFVVSFDAKYHSESYINWENTLTTPSFVLFGAQIDCNIKKDYLISLRMNNLTNERYFTNGYAIGNERYFYANNTFNFLVTLKAKF